MRYSYKSGPNGWQGVIKDDAGRIVWCCGHGHRNRDLTSFTGGISARDCARSVFNLLNSTPEQIAKLDEWYRNPTARAPDLRRLIAQHEWAKTEAEAFRSKWCLIDSVAAASGSSQ